MTAPSKIAVIANRADRDSQGLLADVAEIWRAGGHAVVGVLAELQDDNAACSAGFLRDIVSGRRFSMALDQPPADTSCHLDANGVQAACSVLLPQIDAGDVVLLSKFGKLESGRQGLWEAFEKVVALDKPLLTTVSAKHAESLRAVAPFAVWLDPDRSALSDWWNALAPRAGT